MSYICPVCGYPSLNKDPEYIASFEICPSCHFQFRVSDNDRGFTYEQWRNQWIAEGFLWDKNLSKCPPDWDPRKQLLNIGVRLPDK